MKRTKDPFQQIESPGGPGGRSGGGPKWMGKPRPTEMPKTRMEERMMTRKAAQNPPDYAKRMERKKRFGFKEGGLVPSRSYGK